MSNILNYLGMLLWAGWTGLLDYLAAHVLLCLVPAFVIAGFMSSMIPKESITRFLGPRASKWISYPASAFGGFILAVCSCTILPLFAGIWKRGAGLGPAITFLFVGPAINILAITYTGATIGMDIAIARLVLSIFFGIIIGLIMAWIFRGEESKRATELMANGMF
nr:permease [Anaerolinea sp.]